MNRVVLILTVVIVTASGSGFAAGDTEAGKRIASGICAGCHGVVGVSPNDEWPNLAGQGFTYLVKQLTAFREGTRTDPLMSPMAKALSDADIENLAAWFSTLSAVPSGVAAMAPETALNSYDAPQFDALNGSAETSAVAHVPVSPSSVIKVRPHPTRKYWADQLPEGEGRAVIQEKCQLCHDLQRTLAFVRPKDQWLQVVESMIGRGSPVTPEEIPVIVDYFAEHFGPDSPPVTGPQGVQELIAMKPCKPGEWPRGSSDFRSKWVSPYNVWVSNQLGASIDIVDPVRKDIVSRITCVSAPDRIEFSGDGNTAYAPDRVEHNITVIDTRTGAIVAKIPLIDRPNTAVLSRDFKKLYAGIWPVRGDEDKRGYVQVIDTDQLKVVKTIEVKGGIHDTWMSPDGKLLLAMSPPGHFMDLFDTKDEHKIWTCCTEAEIGTMNMEAGPDGSTSRIFFSYGGYPGIVAIDPGTAEELTRVKLPADKEGPSKGVIHRPPTGKGFGFHGGEISPDGKDYWVTAGSYVYRYELPSLEPVGDVHLALLDQAGESFTPAVEGSWLTISPDGKKVYAVRPGRNLLSEIDPRTMREVALIPTGEYPLHISIWPRGTP
jgi:YVTN family beta-propeller protein